MSSSNAASAAAAALAPSQINPTVSDLLLRSKGEPYVNWIHKIRMQEQRENSEKLPRKILGAQVIPSTTNPASGSAGASLPGGVREIIYEFLGPVPFAEDFHSLNHLHYVCERKRFADTAIAVQYYLHLAHAAAAKGIGEFRITEEIFRKAPCLASGQPVSLLVVALVLEEKRIIVVDGDKHRATREPPQPPPRVPGGPPPEDMAPWRDWEDWQLHRRRAPNPEFDPTNFPIEIQFGLEMDVHEGGAISNRDQIARLLSRRTENSMFFEHFCGSGISSGVSLAGAFVNTLEQTLNRAVEHVVGLVRDAFASGDVQYELTQETWERTGPKLPNGKALPFFQRDPFAMFQMADRGGGLPHHYCVMWLLIVRLRESEVHVETANDETGNEAFPVKFRLKNLYGH
eukprot:g9500.t1